MYVIVWEFHVAAEQVAAFERAYGPDGDWATLFRHSSAFRGLELLRGEGADGDEEGAWAEGGSPGAAYYWTIDRWDSRDAYVEFNERFAREYEAIDARLAALCDAEVCIGKFEVV